MIERVKRSLTLLTALEAVVRYEYDQGMIKKGPKIEELFFPASLQEIQHYL